MYGMDYPSEVHPVGVLRLSSVLLPTKGAEEGESKTS